MSHAKYHRAIPQYSVDGCFIKQVSLPALQYFAFNLLDTFVRKFVFDYNFWFLKHFQTHSLCVCDVRCVVCWAVRVCWLQTRHTRTQRTTTTMAACTDIYLIKMVKSQTHKFVLMVRDIRSILWVVWGVWYCMSWICMCICSLCARGCKRSCTKITVDYRRSTSFVCLCVCKRETCCLVATTRCHTTLSEFMRVEMKHRLWQRQRQTNA